MLSGNVAHFDHSVSEWRGLFTVAGVVAWVQFGCVIMTLIVVLILGREPTTAEEYFTVLQNDRLTGLLRMDFTSLMNVALFTVTGYALFGALKQNAPAWAGIATLFIMVGVVLGLSNHSALSMLYLSEHYAITTDATQRALFVAAGETLIASDWWNSTAGWMAGIFLQGGMTLMSLVMLRQPRFHKATAYTGMLANGLDGAHLLVSLIAPAVGAVLLGIGGLFYLLWYPLLGWDLVQLGQKHPTAKALPREALYE